MLKEIFELIKSKLQEIQVIKKAINGYYFECAPYDAAQPFVIISLGEPQIFATVRGNNWRAEVQIGVLGTNCQTRSILETIGLALDRKIFETDFGKVILQLRELAKSSKVLSDEEGDLF